MAKDRQERTDLFGGAARRTRRLLRREPAFAPLQETEPGGQVRPASPSVEFGASRLIGAPNRWLERPWLLMAALIVCGAALRFWDLAGPSMWLDELSSVTISWAPFGLLWSDWMLYETNPPLYYSLLNLWLRAFGESEFAVRSLSVLLGLLGIVVVFLFARAMHATLAALLAAVFCALSAEQLGFSQEARGYMLGFVAATLAGYALIRLADDWTQGVTPRRSLPIYALYVIATAAAAHTHTTFFVLPILANVFMGWVWLFRTPRRASDALAWINANLILAAACAWWVVVTVRQLEIAGENIAWVPKPDLASYLAMASHIIATRSFGVANALFAAVFAAIAAWGAWKLPPERRVFAIVFGLGVPLVLIAVSFVRPVFLEKTMFWVQFVYLTCLAVGVLTLPWPRLRPALAALIALVFFADALNWSRTAYREPWRQLAAIVRDKAGPQDAVLTDNTLTARDFGYYCRRESCKNIPVHAVKTRIGRKGVGEFFTGLEVSPENVATIARRYESIWVVRRDNDPSLVLRPVAYVERPDVLGDPTGRMALSVWRVKR